MEIGKINISQNFGLVKSKRYKKVELELIQKANTLGRQEDADIMAKALTKLLPKTVLDYDEGTDKFILKDNRKKKKYIYVYEIGFVNRKQPLETFAFLYENLRKFGNGNKKEYPLLKKEKKQ